MQVFVLIIREAGFSTSGKLNTRPQLSAAMYRAKVTGAKLLIGKLDRLSRNVAFIAALQESGAKIVCADMPEANELTVHLLAAMAQQERKMISERAKAALAAAKRGGTKLGNPNGARALKGHGNGRAIQMKIARGGAEAISEAHMMVAGEVGAAAEAFGAMMFGSTPISIIERLREQVAANAPRLRDEALP